MKPPPPRVVSLLPSCTETVCGLGMQALLVGRSHECNFPPEIAGLPVCTRSRIHSDAPSAVIDREVKQRLKDALSLYEIDVALLRRLRPDVVLTQAQCGVCAVSLPEVEAALAGEIGCRPQIVSLSPKRFTDLWTDLQQVAEAVGVADGGREYVQTLKGRVADVIVRVFQLAKRPRVVCLEWLDPLMAAGNWIPDIVELAGGTNLLSAGGAHSPWVDRASVSKADPDVIVVMPCGFDIARTRRELATLTRLPGWSGLRAVKDKRVFLVDGDAFFNRPGPRLVDSVEMLAEVFHPVLFPKPTYEGKGWERI